MAVGIAVQKSAGSETPAALHVWAAPTTPLCFALSALQCTACALPVHCLCTASTVMWAQLKAAHHRPLFSTQLPCSEHWVPTVYYGEELGPVHSLHVPTKLKLSASKVAKNAQWIQDRACLTMGTTTTPPVLATISPTIFKLQHCCNSHINNSE